MLVGTTSIDKSEKISDFLNKKIFNTISLTQSNTKGGHIIAQAEKLERYYCYNMAGENRY